MWNCAACGCQAIAPGVPFCPQCFTTKEDSMPKITVEGGASSRYEPGDEESAVVPPAPETAVEAPQEPQEDQAVQAVQKPEKDVLSELEAAAASLQRPAKPSPES